MTPEQIKEMADFELRVTVPDPMTQNDEALGFISLRSEETHRVIDEVNALLRTQAARIAELEALVAADFDMLDSTWKARAEAAEAEVARLREALIALDRAASEVARYGAQTGPQWSRLTAASLKARAALQPKEGK